MTGLSRALRAIFASHPVAALLVTPGPGDDQAVPVSADAPLHVTIAGGSSGTVSAQFLSMSDFYSAGFQPSADGTLMVQNLCRDCHVQFYAIGATDPQLTAVPDDSVIPVITVAPEHWARVPVQADASAKLNVVMNGGPSEPDHLHEVRAIFVPGLIELAAGEMPRHAAPPAPPTTTPFNYSTGDPAQATDDALGFNTAAPLTVSFVANSALTLTQFVAALGNGYPNGSTATISLKHAGNIIQTWDIAKGVSRTVQGFTLDTPLALGAGDAFQLIITGPNTYWDLIGKRDTNDQQNGDINFTGYDSNDTGVPCVQFIGNH